MSDSDKKTYKLILKEFDQNNPALLKQVKSLLLSGFNFKVHEVQSILNNIPCDIFSSEDITEVTKKQFLVSDLELDVEIITLDAEGNTAKSNSEDESSLEDDKLETQDADNKSQKSAGLDLNSLLVSDDKKDGESEDEESSSFEMAQELSSSEKIKRFYDRNKSWISSSLSMLPLILIAGVALYFTNSILFSRQSDPMDAVKEKLKELSQQAKIAPVREFVGENENDDYSIKATIKEQGGEIISTIISVDFKKIYEPAPEDIILNRELKSSVKKLAVNSTVSSKITNNNFVLSTLGKIDISKAYQIYSDYLDLKLIGKFKPDYTTLDLNIVMIKDFPEEEADFVAKADILKAEQIAVLLKMNCQLTLNVPEEEAI
jgi:hypothetical protein